MDPVELIGEFVGTLIYSYSVTIGSNLGFATAGCIYIAMAFIGYVSTPQFNPAVTLAMIFRRTIHKEITSKFIVQAVGNILVQFFAVFVGGLLGWATTSEVYFFHVEKTYNNTEAFLAEIVYTAVICGVALTAKRVTESLAISAAAISLAYFVGISCVGRISRGCFNPALGFSLNLLHTFKEGNGFGDTWIYILAPVVGAIVGTAAAIVFIEKDEDDDPRKHLIETRTKSIEGFIRS